MDGASSNLSMCTALGANFQYVSNFKPYFINPVTFEQCFVFLDLCHAIKLVRNILEDKKILITIDDNKIMWYFIVKLHQFQKEQGLRAANKLTNKHINYQNGRMNVKLAMQTLSNSVYKAFDILMKLNDNSVKSKFKDCMPTAKFCLQFNNMTDMLNCKNRFSKETFNTLLTDDNYV